MEKNLFRYFSLLLVSFSVTTFGQIKLIENAYAVETQKSIENHPFNQDMNNFRICTGETLNVEKDNYNVFNADLINNMYKVQIQFDGKQGLNVDDYIVTGTGNIIVGAISDTQPYTITANLQEGSNIIKILSKSNNEEMYRFNINYKNIKVKGLDSIINVGDNGKIEAVLNDEVYKNIIWSTDELSTVVVNKEGAINAVQNGIATITGTLYDDNNNINGNVNVQFNISGNGTFGWIKNGEQWYYLDKDTNALKTGWLQDKGDWYYFNDDGSLYTGWLKLEDRWYYLKPTGNMAIGWFKDEGNWYYSNEDGSIKTGWFKDHGNWYYFNESGKMQTSDVTINGVLFKFNKNGELQLS